MDSRTASGALPAFVEIIKQLTPDEARIVRLFAIKRPFPLVTVRWDYKNQTESQRGGKDVLVNFSLLGLEAGCELPNLTPTYLDNLCRLGLAEIPFAFEFTAPGVYAPLENHPQILAAKQSIEANPEFTASINRRGLRVTELGKRFCSACVVRCASRTNNAIETFSI